MGKTTSGKASMRARRAYSNLTLGLYALHFSTLSMEKLLNELLKHNKRSIKEVVRNG